MAGIAANLTHGSNESSSNATKGNSEVCPQEDLAAKKQKLWKAYQASPNEDAPRNALTEVYLPLVRSVAERVHRSLPQQVDVDDLFSSGTFGLMEAISRFDPSREVKFETYASQRIKGAILDWLRATDWVPRLVRQRATMMFKAEQELSSKLGRMPTDEEKASHLSNMGEDPEKVERDSKAISMVSINRPSYDSSDSSRQLEELHILGDESQASPLELAQHKDLKEYLANGFRRDEQMILVLYYYEDMTMREIGETLELSESRVSQLHSSLLERLKARMMQREAEFTE